MKFFLVCALLFIARGLAVPNAKASDRDVLQELEDLIDHKSNDDKQIKQDEDKFNIIMTSLGKIADEEHVNDKPLNQREKMLVKVLSKLADEPETKRVVGNLECKDRYSRCSFYVKKNYCYRAGFGKVLRNYCSKSCGFCDCRNSKFGCCQDHETRAEGSNYKGCEMLLCYDRYASSEGLCEKLRKQGYCETAKDRMMVSCAQTCEYCTIPAKAAAEKKCNDVGYGCCSNGEAALGPNKLGCPPCADRGRHICGKVWNEKDCSSKGIYLRLSMKRVCPRLCGYCRPS